MFNPLSPKHHLTKHADLQYSDKLCLLIKGAILRYLKSFLWCTKLLLQFKLKKQELNYYFLTPKR